MSYPLHMLHWWCIQFEAYYIFCHNKPSKQLTRETCYIKICNIFWNTNRKMKTNKFTEQIKADMADWLSVTCEVGLHVCLTDLTEIY